MKNLLKRLKENKMIWLISISVIVLIIFGVIALKVYDNDETDYLG